MSTAQPYLSSGFATPSPYDGIQSIQSPSTPKAPQRLLQNRFPSAPSSEARPTITPSTSFSSSSSYASFDVRDILHTPPPNPNKGFRLPRFSLWGQSTPESLLADSTVSLSPPSNVTSNLSKLHVSKERTYSLQSSANDHHLDILAHSDLESSSQAPPMTLPATQMPALTIHEAGDLLPRTSPKQSSIWRLRGGLFASSSSPSAHETSLKGLAQTADPTIPRDTAIVPPPSRFAACSEVLQGPTPPNRSTTFSSISSASCSSSSRPDLKKIRSQESIRSAASVRPADIDLSTSYSVVPAPKATKTKLRSKSKSSKEVDFDRVFLAQELHAPHPTSNSGSIGRSGSEAISPPLLQSEFPSNTSPESRRKRASWVPRRSTSPHAVHGRRSTDLVSYLPRASLTRSSTDHLDGNSQAQHAEAFPERGRVNRQLSTSSHHTTNSSAATHSTYSSDVVPPKSPMLAITNISGELDTVEEIKTKRSKSATPKCKTYALQFSLDGRYLAAAGSDHLIRVYEVIASHNERAEEIELAQPQRTEDFCTRKLSAACPTSSVSSRSTTKSDIRTGTPDFAPVFRSVPVRVFAAHSGDVLDLSWSKNNFLLSCSSDKTAKLWHPNRSECLCTFATAATVSSVDFHPTDDRFFVTGGLDGKLRLWNITARRVQSVHDIPGVITAVAFSSSGQVVCVGTHSGSMITFSCSDTLAYVNTVTVKSAAASKSTQASKITSIHPIKLGSSSATQGPSTPTGEAGRGPSSAEAEYMTVTSNDSRIRIYSIASRRLISRFKSASYLNRSSQIRATASCDSQFVVSGSEDASIHVWSLAGHAPLLASLFSGIKRNKSIKSSKGSPDVRDHSTWRSWQAGSGSVRCAIFAPATTAQLLSLADDPLEQQTQTVAATVKSRIIVSTDDSNAIRVWRSDPQGRLI
ncbi:hypothetical protein NDA11_007497 [Ustilago hordei]|nr:hypothetical protein NDA10_004767 [Ustilago hordei]KAJ1583495.1 hypothetical protein NDA15_004061 [Ustilago hordei]KAJ1586890.1 hypothetical protein NDA11_007497 [Ustilago hordei]KAJ1592187.1 hypothetical protein NDA12_006331 [Ustilago hordei]KAJ1602949.1 hypothetical protein NDA14_002217 [Ustilago hordei]